MITLTLQKTNTHMQHNQQLSGHHKDFDCRFPPAQINGNSSPNVG